MNRLKEFTVTALTSGGNRIVYTAIEEGLNEKSLEIYICGKISSLPLDDEDSFIEKIENTGINNLNGKFFSVAMEDGWGWVIHIAYDDKDILVKGSNAEPVEAVNLFALIGFMVNETTGKKKELIKVKNLNEAERITAICHIHEIDRLLSDIWEESDLNYDGFSYKSDKNGTILVGTSPSTQLKRLEERNAERRYLKQKTH